MKHPLATQSLAPQGFVFPLYKERLHYRPKNELHYINPEMLMGKFWEKVNRADASEPLPIHTIIHTILPKLKHSSKKGEFYFRDKPYMSRDVCLVSSIVQWFATSVGNGFLEKSDRMFSEVEASRSNYYQEKHLVYQKRGDMLKYWTHTCTPQCYNTLRYTIFDTPHVLDAKSVTARDRAVANAVMIWLDTDTGNAFVKAWYERRERAGNILHSDQMRRLKLKRLKLKIQNAA